MNELTGFATSWEDSCTRNTNVMFKYPTTPFNLFVMALMALTNNYQGKKEFGLNR